MLGVKAFVSSAVKSTSLERGRSDLQMLQHIYLQAKGKGGAPPVRLIDGFYNIPR